MTLPRGRPLGRPAPARSTLRFGITAACTTWVRVAAPRLEPLALAGLSLGAAAIHFGVISEHFAEDIRFGIFFALVGWFEALWAVGFALLAARWLAGLGLIASVGTVAVWIWAHLIGLPFGPNAGSIEMTMPTDLMATLFEILLAVWLAARLLLGGKVHARVALRTSVGAVALLMVAIAVATTIVLR